MKYDYLRFELYSYDKKVPRKKCFEMLDILTKFYNDFNGMNNGTKEMYEPWIKMIRNTKDYYVLLCYEKDLLIAFITYMYQDIGLMISEVQIRSEYQNKGYLTILLKELILNSDTNRYDDVFVTIHKNNINSQNVFNHIGFTLIKDTLYRMKSKDLVKRLESR